MLHADETTDRVGAATCWMHVVSTRHYTLIHVSGTRGTDAIRYVCDNGAWFNDEAADAYEANDFGVENSMLDSRVG